MTKPELLKKIDEIIKKAEKKNRNIHDLLNIRLLVLFGISDQPERVKWEYRFEEGIGIEEFNKLGEEGWELISIPPMERVLIFKRPKI